jgi:hypothetical protein
LDVRNPTLRPIYGPLAHGVPLSIARRVSCGSNLPDQDGQVLGVDLNRSESSRQPACPGLSLPPPLANAAMAA